MKLPNADIAFVHPDKIAEYLLNVSHPRGKSKAKFFTRRGFSVNDLKS